MDFLVYELVPPQPVTPQPALSAVVEELRALGVTRVHSVAWRDLDDPEAGGSEVHADNILSRWAAAGLTIHHRTSTAGAARHFVRHGYTVTQRGGRYGVFPREILRQMFSRHNYDAVIEIWNGVPWFAALWARRPRVTWMHHIHTDMWKESLPALIAPLGPILESHVAPPFYKRSPLVTLAEPTRSALIDKGFRPNKVHVVSPGISAEFSPSQTHSTSDALQIVAVGRLAPVKQFDDLISIVASLVPEFPELKLTIVGDGPERQSLTALVTRLGMESNIILAGRVDLDELVHLYRVSSLLVSASHSEGWGMTVTEAAACGTPAVVLDNEGHRAAVENGVSGIVAPTLDELKTAISSLLSDHDTRDRLARGALARAQTFTWDNAALASLCVLRDEVVRRSR